MTISTSGNKFLDINFEGSFFVHHSLGMVNRELLFELQRQSTFDFRILRHESDQYQPDAGSKFASLLDISSSPHKEPHIYIRHHFPPNFSKPRSGKLVVIFPWEYGSLPVDWCNQMKTNVDEIWVYSTYLKDCYEKSGIPAEKIIVIPAGIDPILFNPSCKPSQQLINLKEGHFCFFYNGGATVRKGVDILVNAYLNEFRVHEKVCLIIKDSFSYGKGLATKIQKLSERNDTAKIHYVLQNFAHEELPSLYKACDCYVHPYRSEGYGLPIAEALACGKPVIVTGAGAANDFVNETSGYQIKSSKVYMKERQISGMQTVDYPYWHIPDMNHLQLLMRHVFEHPHEARQKGLAGAITMKNAHTWALAAPKAIDRLLHLVK